MRARIKIKARIEIRELYNLGIGKLWAWYLVNEYHEVICKDGDTYPSKKEAIQAAICVRQLMATAEIEEK